MTQRNVGHVAGLPSGGSWRPNDRPPTSRLVERVSEAQGRSSTGCASYVTFSTADRVGAAYEARRPRWLGSEFRACDGFWDPSKGALCHAVALGGAGGAAGGHRLLRCPVVNCGRERTIVTSRRELLGSLGVRRALWDSDQGAWIDGAARREASRNL